MSTLFHPETVKVYTFEGHHVHQEDDDSYPMKISVIGRDEASCRAYLVKNGWIGIELVSTNNAVKIY